MAAECKAEKNSRKTPHIRLWLPNINTHTHTPHIIHKQAKR